MPLTNALALLPLIGYAEDAPPALPREFRAVWIATVDNIDWPSKRTLDVPNQQAELVRQLDLAKSLNLNAVIFQVRPSADALYPSRLEPWSEYLTGKQGKGPDPEWDPLAFAVQQAHARGLELHAWFNPYRALHPSQKGGVAANHVSRTHPSDVVSYGKFLWMDPGSRFVQRRSRDVILDVVRRYDIDGVHIDDYFYPYPEKGSNGKTLDFPDDRTWGAYRKSGSDLSRDDWRRKNVDDFIEALYDGIKREKRWVKFGISPFGIYRPGIPEGIQAGIDQYAELYADAKRWLNEGWCDYYTPQLYWATTSRGQSYGKLLDWWMGQNTKQRHLWPGNFTSRLDPTSTGWSAKEIVDQITLTRRQGASGNVHFSMKAFTKNWGRVVETLRTGPYNAPALVPASDWLDPVAPNPPEVTVRRFADDTRAVRWQPHRDRDVRFYAVSFYADGWSMPEVSDAQEGIVRPISGQLPTRVSVVAIDRAGNESRPTIKSL